jgi:hypothetical protein
MEGGGWADYSKKAVFSRCCKLSLISCNNPVLSFVYLLWWIPCPRIHITGAVNPGFYLRNQLNRRVGIGLLGVGLIPARFT